jgi:hypothetical protein
MLTRLAADFKITRRKSTEQKIGNLFQVRAPETIFSGKCGLRARTVTPSNNEKQRYLRTMSPDDRSKA